MTPGFIDCHTHLVFGGDRSGEFEQRLEGVSYAEIAAQRRRHREHGARDARSQRGRAVRERAGCARSGFLREGVTTIEVKSGYGLDLANERKMLHVARRLAERTAADRARDVPRRARVAAGIRGPRGRLHRVRLRRRCCRRSSKEGLVDAVDAFCEHLAFSPQQVERVFRRARELGLPVKLHAEQLSSLHGS